MSYNNPSRKHVSRLSTPVRLGVAAVAACFISAPVQSLPVNPTVVNGAATFNQAGKVLTVTNSNGAIINWQKFSIKAGETTHFAQTSASSSVLNRVLNDPTAIYGTLSSNGRVWLVNPAGIMVGPGGRVDVAGFVASTLNIRNEDFLAGRNVFIDDGSAQNVINQGRIRTPAGGSVYLIGSNVSNEGIITTQQGETILAAGATVSLIDSATPGVKVDITGTEGNATNLGRISAEAGRIGIAGVIVRNSGTLNASSVVSEGGRVFLKASQDAYVDGNGRIVTTGTRGGSVEVLGNRVAVMDNAEIDASGVNGGGRIMVGGDYQGKNPDIQNASISYFGPNASLKADATEVGDGGTVIVWADDTTRAYGSISARGGALGGNGGFVETSGHNSLSISGARVDTRAPNGTTGSWLLDPTNIDIVSGGLGPVVGPGVFDPLINSTITDSDVNFALVSSDLIIQTSGGSGGVGNITANGVNIYGGNSLTLAAYGGGSATGNITIDGSTINLSSGGFTALAGWYGGTTHTKSDVIEGKGNITISASQIFASGYIDLHAGKDITLGHQTPSSAGTWIESFGSMFVSAQNLSLYGGSAAIFDISSPQGPGVMLRGFEQEIEVDNQILLQAGSANNTFYGGFGSMFYGGSVTIQSGSDQQIEATVLKLVGGAQGHDNAATVDANGDQLIILGSYGGAAGQLIITGGGGNIATYGGAYGGGTGGGSYNNFAELRQGNLTGSQVIILESAGSKVELKGGGGTGYGGNYFGDPANAGWSSNNYAAVHNQGNGGQVIDFHYGGTLTVTGGTLGNANYASIGNNSLAGMLLIYSSNGLANPAANLPAITLYGGASGGKDDLTGSDNLSNSADIYSEASVLTQVYGSSITIYGGGNATTIGGAGISANNLWLETPGNLSLYGGASNVATALPIPGAATAAYIGTEDSGGTITIKAGGDISLVAGAYGGGAVLIGSVNDAPSSTTIDIGAYGGITLTSGANSSVAIGNMSPAGYGGADVTLLSIGHLTVNGTDNAPVLIGSLWGGAAPTNVTLGSMRNVTLTKANVGSWNGDATSIAVYGGFMENGGPSPYGGSLSFTSTKFGSALGDAAIGFYAAAYGGAGGNISFSDGGGAYGASIDIVAARDLQLGTPTASKGVRLQTTTGLMSITANNFYAYGGTGIRGPNDVNLIGDPVPYGGAGIGVLAGTAGQTITVAGTLLLQAGAISNPNGSGSSYYGGSVTFLSAGNQSISAGTLKLAAGTAGHDNVAQIIGEGATQDITVSTLLDLKGGGGGNNNYAWIGATGASGVQTIDASGASIVLTGGTSGGAPNQENGADISLSDMTNTGGSQTVFAGNININGGSSSTTYGGAGFGTGNGLDQSFYVTGDLSMNGGASPAYIGSEYGGGTITVQVGGKIALNGGSGTYGGVLIGSLDDSLGATTVTLSAAKGITATGAAGGVLLGVKNLTGTIGNSVALNAGWDGIAPSGYGGDITLTGPMLIKTDGATGNVDVVANESSAGDYGSVTIGTGTGTVVYGSSIGIVAGGNNTVYGSLISTGDIYLDAGRDNSALTSSLRGGDLNLKAGSNLQAGTNVDMYARAGTGSPYGGGNITQYGSVAGNGGVSMYADRNIAINGTVTSSAGDLYARAGYSSTRQFGGNIEVRGALTGEFGVDLIAEAGTSSPYGGGNITQYGSGSITTGYGEVRIIGGGSVDLRGSIDGGEGGSTAVTVKAGFSDYTGTVTPYGGNISLAATSAINGYGGVYLYAESGSASGANGNITQNVTSTAKSVITAYGGDVAIFGGGNVTLSGNASAYGGFGSVKAGYSVYGGMASANGGDITVSGKLFADYDLELFASAGSSAGLNGNITQSSGSISSANNSIRIYADGNVNLNGLVTAPDSLYFRAGVDNGSSMGSYSYTSQYGGNITLGASSRVYGGFVGLAANGGYYGGISATGSSTGNISQAADGQLMTSGSNSLYGYAAGNVELLGSIIASSTAYIDAGRDLTGGGRYAFANKHITISSLETDDSSVYLTATGPIFVKTKNASSIYADIFNTTSGGIEIRNTGAAQPGSVNLQDNATANSAVTFTHTGSDVSVDGSMSFTTYGGLGDILIAAPANKLTYYGAGTLSGANVLLGAGSVLNMYGGLTTVGTLGLAAGGSLNIDSAIGGSNVTLVAPTVNIRSGVAAIADASVTGSTIDIDGGSVTGADILFRGPAFGTGNLKLSNGGSADATGQIEFNLANVDASYGGHLAATSSTSNITGFVSGNITLDSGAYFLAGDDIDLTLTGSTSTVSLSNGAHMVSDAASGTAFTTFLNFLARSGDGVTIDGVTTTTSTAGGSGFFVFDSSTPATTTSGGGLVITYANAVVVDPCAASPDLCSPPSPIDPIIDVVEADPCATSPDSAQCKAIKSGEKEKDEEDVFGDADDGKKDEKSSQKKVAQCGV